MSPIRSGRKRKASAPAMHEEGGVDSDTKVRAHRVSATHEEADLLVRGHRASVAKRGGVDGDVGDGEGKRPRMELKQDQGVLGRRKWGRDTLGHEDLHMSTDFLRFDVREDSEFFKTLMWVDLPDCRAPGFHGM